MDRLAVIGDPVSHSLSPALHQRWYKELGIAATYEAVHVTAENLSEFVTEARKNYLGFNVTLPHKQTIMGHLDQVDDIARNLGAVNTVLNHNGQLVGTNTDAIGFATSLDEAAPDWCDPLPHAVVLGAGGAARAVIAALQAYDATIILSNRTMARAYVLAAEAGAAVCNWPPPEAVLARADILINTTSLGMKGQPPLSLALEHLPEWATVVDIVYRPLETDLLKAARARGLRCVSGLGMLIEQAAAAHEIWFGARPPVTEALYQWLTQTLQTPTPQIQTP